MSGAERNWQGDTGNRSGGQQRGGYTKPSLHSDAKALELVTASAGTFNDIGKLNTALKQLAGKANIVTPLALAPAIPDGHSAVVSVVQIDLETEAYKVGNKWGLSKQAIERIAAASGVSIVTSERTDDRKTPLFCAWRAVVQAPDLHGRIIQRPGSVELDLRDGSDEYQAFWTEPKNYANGGKSDPEAAIKVQRRFISRIAESKAINRALRGILAIPAAMDEATARKPFVAIQIVLDGHFEDPELRRAYGLAKIAQATGAANLLTGKGPAPVLEPDLVLDEADEDFEDADVVDEPGPGPDESQDTEAPGRVVFPDGHPLSNVVLIGLAKLKGKLGTAHGQLTEDAIDGFDGETRQRLLEKLEGMPDAKADPIPF